MPGYILHDLNTQERSVSTRPQLSHAACIQDDLHPSRSVSLGYSWRAVVCCACSLGRGEGGRTRSRQAEVVAGTGPSRRVNRVRGCDRRAVAGLSIAAGVRLSPMRRGCFVGGGSAKAACGAKSVDVDIASRRCLLVDRVKDKRSDRRLVRAPGTQGRCHGSAVTLQSSPGKCSPRRGRHCQSHYDDRCHAGAWSCESPPCTSQPPPQHLTTTPTSAASEVCWPAGRPGQVPANSPWKHSNWRAGSTPAALCPSSVPIGRVGFAPASRLPAFIIKNASGTGLAACFDPGSRRGARRRKSGRDADQSAKPTKERRSGRDDRAECRAEGSLWHLHQQNNLYCAKSITKRIIKAPAPR